MTPRPDQIAARLVHIEERIERAGGDPEAVTVVAVTKGFDSSVVRAALAAGCVDIGENYAQELLAKASELPELTSGSIGSDDPGDALSPPAVRVHFIGRLQRNKVRQLAGLVSLWQSVDRIELGREIAKRAPGARVLMQLNVSGEPQKGGVPLADADALADELTALGLALEGV